MPYTYVYIYIYIYTYTCILLFCRVHRDIYHIHMYIYIYIHAYSCFVGFTEDSCMPLFNGNCEEHIFGRLLVRDLKTAERSLTVL